MDRSNKLGKIGFVLILALAWTSVLVFFVWTAGAIYYFSFLPKLIAVTLAIIYLLGGIYLFWKLKPKRKWLKIAAFSIVAMYLVGWIQQPSSDRDWDKDQAKSPLIVFDGNRVSIQDFRNNHYRSESDFDARFETFDFELDQITGVWFVVQRFIELEAIAHTFVTFEVQTGDGPKFFSVSIEIRREKGEVYSPIQGMYRAYELIYVIGDERDLIGVRTVMRPNDRIFMYPANATAEQAQGLFVEIANRANKLIERPEFYNSFLNNCNNNIVHHAYKLTPEPVNWLDPRVAIPGYTDRFALSKQLIGEPGQSFDELSSQCRIDELARAEGITDDFSLAIRKRKRK